MDISRSIDDIKEAINETDFKYVNRFLTMIHLNDGRLARLELVLKFEDDL